MGARAEADAGAVGNQRSMARVTFHGVRGSTPVHDDTTRRYGGNTSCVSVDIPGERPLVFDLGTGLRYFGECMPHDGSYRGICLLTHLHWDHIQGLPFFVPMLRDGALLEVHAPVQDDGRSIDEVFRSIIRPPVFPVDLDVLPGRFRFVEHADDDFDVNGLRVMSRLVPHLGNTLGYRVTWQGRSITYISDHQQSASHPDDFDMSAGVRDLAQDADVLIHDAQFTPEEFEAKRDWGHCTIDYAIWVAEQCSVRTLVLFHHDPGHHDDMLDAVAAHHERVGDGLRVVVAHEGMVLTV